MQYIIIKKKLNFNDPNGLKTSNSLTKKGENMNVLIVYAHPEPRSLNGNLKTLAMETLKKEGHQVKISDLYAMKFKATLDEEDFSNRSNPEFFNPILEQVNAVATDTLPSDIKEEVDKLRWADFVLLQFPIWWSSVPAILKGWFDRVFLPGVAHNIAEGKIYDTGLLKGKKAMLSYTTGATNDLYSAQGPHGDIDEILKYITYNILTAAGMEVLPSSGIFGASTMEKEEVQTELDKFKDLLKGIN